MFELDSNEEQDPIEASLEEFEQELFSSKEEKQIFYQAQERQARQDLSEARLSMERLSESLPEKVSDIHTDQYAIYERIQKQIEELKIQIAEKNKELMGILKQLEDLSSE